MDKEYPLLTKLVTGNNLSAVEANQLVTLFFVKNKQQFTSSALLLLRKKGEHLNELVSLVQYLRNHLLQVKVTAPHLVDFCGTGGDQKDTFNISTLSAIVAAGAGANVVKHGNRSVSSQCGSSDILLSLGYNLNIKPSKASKILKETNFTYLHAPLFHPVFAQVQPIRLALKTKTIFNFLGPLLNPAKVPNQIIGVSEPSLLNLYPQILKQIKSKHAWVFIDDAGYDEISLTGSVQAIQIRNGIIKKHKLTASSFGLKKIRSSSLVTKSKKENLQVANAILSGKEKGAKKDVVIANSALGLFASGRASSLKEGVALARFSLETGRALQTLKQSIKLSR